MKNVELKDNQPAEQGKSPQQYQASLQCLVWVFKIYLIGGGVFCAIKVFITIIKFLLN